MHKPYMLLVCLFFISLAGAEKEEAENYLGVSPDQIGSGYVPFLQEHQGDIEEYRKLVKEWRRQRRKKESELDEEDEVITPELIRKSSSQNFLTFFVENENGLPNIASQSSEQLKQENALKSSPSFGNLKVFLKDLANKCKKTKSSDEKLFLAVMRGEKDKVIKAMNKGGNPKSKQVFEKYKYLIADRYSHMAFASNNPEIITILSQKDENIWKEETKTGKTLQEYYNALKQYQIFMNEKAKKKKKVRDLDTKIEKFKKQLKIDYFGS